MADVTSVFLKIIPIIFLIPLGYLLKRARLLKKEDANVMNTLFVEVALPATLFLAFASLELNASMILLPAIGLVVVLALLLIGYAIISILRPEKTVKDIFMIIMPTLAPATVAYPFFIRLFDEVGLATIALINIGNILFLFSIDRHIAMKYGHKKEDTGTMMKDFAGAPVIWATAAGLAVAWLNIHSQLAVDFFQLLANATIFIIMISLGLGFEWKPNIMKKILPIILIKTSAGLLVGYFLSVLFHFSGLQQIALIIFAFVPPSTVTYVFVTEAKLEKAFEADLLSLSLPIGVGLTGLLLIFTEVLTSPAIVYISVPFLVLGLILMKTIDS